MKSTKTTKKTAKTTKPVARKSAQSIKPRAKAFRFEPTAAQSKTIVKLRKSGSSMRAICVALGISAENPWNTLHRHVG